MAAVETWKWFLALAFLAGSAFCSGTETALTALGEARARQLRETGGRRARLLGLWIDHPERVLSTLLIGNTLVNIGAGALAASVAADLVHASPSWAEGTAVAVATALTTVVVLFFGEIIPKTLAKRHPVQVALGTIPAVQALCAVMWPVSSATTRATSAIVRLFGGGSGAPGPAVTSEEIEYLIEMGTREGVLDEVKEELLNSVLEFADRVVKEIMVPRTRMVAIDKEASQDELVRAVTENPYSRMPVYSGSVDNVVGVLMVRDIVQELRRGPIRDVPLDRYLKPAFFVPEQMKISRLLKEMQRRHVHLAVVVDEFGGTSGLVTLEDVIEEIVGEIQDEADAEAAPVKALGEGIWLADAAVQLHDLEEFLNGQAAPAAPGAEGGGAPPPEIRFPEEGDYGTLGGFVTATAGRVPPAGAEIAWDGLVFTVRAGDERRVTRVEIARRGPAPEG
ncbi:MAG TPA: hemolysin family protein, partial [Anaeromyxobacteraceae bacterium]|nr:hemolysin family protein [Anaeromyxobacteraceae bacterium]